MFAALHSNLGDVEGPGPLFWIKYNFLGHQIRNFAFAAMKIFRCFSRINISQCSTVVLTLL